MAARRPKIDVVLDDVRVRVYATRSEYEVLYGDADISDPTAYVRCYRALADEWRATILRLRSERDRPVAS